MQPVTIHYWAGAKAAAGVAVETVQADTVKSALEAALARRSNARFERVIRASAVLIDGVTAHEDDLSRRLDSPTEIEVLPPFAGGSPSVSPPRGL